MAYNPMRMYVHIPKSFDFFFSPSSKAEILPAGSFALPDMVVAMPLICPNYIKEQKHRLYIQRKIKHRESVVV
jgi:hypothetical protein